MKKILLILITGLFISTNAYSDHNEFTQEIANKIVANSDNTLKKRWKKVAAIKDSDWMYECDKEDFIKHVAIKEGCVGLLALNKIDKSKKNLIIFLEGDYRGKKPNDVKKHYPMKQAIKEQDGKINFFYMARTGHKYSSRTRSTGKRTNSQMSGDWNAIYKKSWEARRLTGAAIKKLKEHYQPDKLIVMGHSGGAGDTLMIAGKMPGLIDIAIASGCDCLSGWPNAEWNLWNGKPEEQPWESASNQIAHIDPKTKIILLHSKKDEWCPFKNTEEYARRAKEQGLDVTLHIQKGKHDFKSLSGRNEIFKEIFSSLQ